MGKYKITYTINMGLYEDGRIEMELDTGKINKHIQEVDKVYDALHDHWKKRRARIEKQKDEDEFELGSEETETIDDVKDGL